MSSIETSDYKRRKRFVSRRKRYDKKFIGYCYEDMSSANKRTSKKEEDYTGIKFLILLAVFCIGWYWVYKATDGNSVFFVPWLGITTLVFAAGNASESRKERREASRLAANMLVIPWLIGFAFAVGGGYSFHYTASTVIVTILMIGTGASLR